MQHSALIPSAPPIDGLDHLLSAALDSAPVGLVVLSADRSVRLVTAAASAMLGLTSPAWTGQPMAELLATCAALPAESRLLLGTAIAAAAGEAADLRLDAAGASGPRMLAADIRPAGASGWVLSLEDVTRTRQTQDWLLEHASSDAVTGLWNRHHFMVMLEDSLVHEPAPQALLLVGLQRLKLVNDTLGLGAGDTLLRLVAERLCAHMGEGDMLARFAGDEFALAVGNPDMAALRDFTVRLAADLALPYVIESEAVTIGVHLGVACSPGDGGSAQALVAHAGLALRDTARRGAAPVRFFDPALMERAYLRRALETDLRSALPRGQFELHYQPQVDVHRGRVTGLEALIRWRSPQRGLVPPGEFIQLAEQVGLINDIGNWVLAQACREAAHWPREVTVAVNASPLQFETGQFARRVAEALAETGLAPHRLEIEITESLLLRDTGTVTATLAALHDLGVRVVLDDFGTGYASLSQLSRFRFDKIKIDRSFVSPTDSSAENSAIVRSIAALGNSLSIPTTAEGVETAKQLEQIIADGCTCVQGYYFSRPVPSDQVDSLLKRLHRREMNAAA